MVFQVIGPAKKVSKKKRQLRAEFSMDKPIVWTAKKKKEMDKRLRKILAHITPLIPEDKWCKCPAWRDHWDTLQNLDRMNFCVFCGKELNKGGMKK